MIRWALAAGSRVLLHPAFRPDSLLDEIVRHGGTHLAFGDDMLGRMHAAWSERRRELGSLRWVGIGDFNGDSHRLARWLADEFGTETVGVYGSSEVFALISLWSTRDCLPGRWNGGGHLVGPAMSMRIQADDGSLAVAGGEGGRSARPDAMSSTRSSVPVPSGEVA